MGTKNFSNANDLITFSRSSAGTALRKIAYGSELVTNGTFDTDASGWTAEVGVDATVTSGEVQLLNTAAGTGRNFYQTVVTEVGKVYSVSYYCQKTPGGTTIVFAGDSAGSSTGGDQQTVLGDEDSSFVFVAGQASTYITCRIGGTDGQGAIFDNISVKEVLFDQGTLTLFNHPADIPRIEYDADGNVLGLLVEESRTNLVTASALPPLLGATRDTANNITSPTQELNGGLVVEDTSLNAHGIRQTSILPTAGAAEYTVSVFAKAKERSFLRMQMYGDAVAHTLEGWDLTAGTAPSGGTIQDCGNGWYRCSGTFTVANTTGGFNYASVYLGESSGSYYYTGDGSSGAYMFGFQVEAGAFPTSYIPTAGATATRSADVASIPVADLGYNQSEGSVVCEFETFDTSSVGRVFSFNDNTGNNFIDSYSTNTSHLFVRDSGTNQASIDAGEYTDNALAKVGAAFKVNDFAVTIDGGAIGADSVGIIPLVTKLNIGSYYNGGSQLNGHIKSIRYYPRRLTNAQLQELTT